MREQQIIQELQAANSEIQRQEKLIQEMQEQLQVKKEAKNKVSVFFGCRRYLY